MLRQAVILVTAAALVLAAELNAAPVSAPAPASNELLAISVNTTGSVGNLCSSQAGILSFLEGATANQTGASLANLNISVPVGLANGAALPQIAQVGAPTVDDCACFATGSIKLQLRYQRP